MSFAYSGGLITQSGTDTDLSGLVGLTGVTTAGVAGKKIYYVLDAVNLRITGSLTINPDYECIIFNENAPYPCLDYYNGTLTIGAKTVVGDAVRYSGGDAIIILRAATVLYDTSAQAGIRQSVNGGTFNAYGGTIVSNSPISFTGTNTATRNGTVNIEKLTYKPLSSSQCRFDNSAGQPVNIKGLTLDGGGTPTSTVILFSTDFDSFSANLANGSIQSFSSQLKGLLFTDMTFANNISANDIRLNGGGECLVFRDSDKGSSANISRGSGACQLLFAGTANIECFDPDGAVEGAKYYIADTNDGNRRAPTGTTTDITYYTSRMNTAGSNVYSGMTDVNGEASPIIILSILNVINGTNYTYSDYSNYGSMSDKFDIKIINYAHSIDSRAEVLRGNGGKDVVVPLLFDLLITESDKAVVDAYTTLDTARQVYDRAKAFLYDNYLGESSTIVSRVGSQVDLAAKDLVIDATAASVFANGGNTVTIKSSTFTAGATATTGTVTTTNGALLDGGTFDCDIVYDSGAGTTITNVLCTGAVDFTVAGAYTLVGCTLAEVTNSSGGAVILEIDNDSTVSVNTGPDITINTPLVIATINLPNIIDDSKYLFFIDGVATGGLKTVSGGAGISETFTAGTDFTAGDSWEVWIVYYDAVLGGKKVELDISGVFGSTTETITRAESQVNCPVCEANGLNGADYEAEYDIDNADDEIDIDLPAAYDNRELYAYLSYAQTLSEANILDLFGAFGADDVANYWFDHTRITLMLDNTTSTDAVELSGTRWYVKNGADADPVKRPRTGTGAVDVNWREKVYTSVVTVSGSNVVTGDIADIPAAVWTHSTRGLTETADADIKYVNGVEVTGTGAPGDTWGPA